MRQLNDEPKPVYKVGFIREKGKATTKVLQRSLEAGGSLLGEGWGFYGCFNSGLGSERDKLVSADPPSRNRYRMPRADKISRARACGM
jgi:hypothetical protein